MKISYNWLKEYVDTDAPPDELAEILTMGGLEVEGLERIGSNLDGVVVGHILEVRPHPNADRLTLCDVDAGYGEPLQIVCGAPNVASGQKVPVATIGATVSLPDRENPEARGNVEIRRTKLRGEISEGMICAEDELGLSDDHSGVMVLREDARVGTPLERYLRESGRDVSDTVLDVSITPNRPDAASHIGVARDAAALTRAAFIRPEVSIPSTSGLVADDVSVEILAEEACPRYAAMVVRGVTVRESPPWLKGRLAAIGLRPRNNVVDVTNFVLHEVGQPLHAFDLDEIADATIRVRLTDGETNFRTLDGKQRALPPGTMMIADAQRDVAVAGVMGGENSEVTEKTRNVLIESAYFDPRSIRRTAKALGLQTDASYRFERGVDPEGQVWAAARAAELIARLAGGEIIDGVVDARSKRTAERRIAVRSTRIHALLGVAVPAEESERLLESIGFRVEVRGAANSEAILDCAVPSFRPDVEREIDVIEEVVRLYGFDRIPQPARTTIPALPPRLRSEEQIRRLARGFLSSSGYREIYTNSMLSRAAAEQVSTISSTGEYSSAELVETLNPISQEMAAMRPSLAAGALQVMSYNRKHGQRTLRFFEFGHTYRRRGSGRESGDGRGDHDGVIPGYLERDSLLLAASGPAAPASWDVKERLLDLFDAKGAVAALLESIRVPDFRFDPVGESATLLWNGLEIRSDGQRIGILGQLVEGVAEGFDLTDPAFIAELDWSRIVSMAMPQLDRRYQRVSRYPVVDRDLAVVVNRDEPAGPMMETIEKSGGKLLQSVDVFDLFDGEAIGSGKKSIAFSLRFGAERTLTDDEVDARMGEIIDALATAHGAALRS